MAFKQKIKDVWAKVKTVKNIEIIIGIVIIAVIAIIYSNIATKKASNDDESVQESNTKSASTISYNQDDLDSKLASILSEIDGAGKVDVLITYYSTSELETANTKNSHSSVSNGSTNSNESVTETITPLVVNGEIVILKEIMPEVKGVIVVAEGANDIKVRLNLLRAVQTILDMDANAIEIFAGK